MTPTFVTSIFVTECLSKVGSFMRTIWNHKFKLFQKACHLSALSFFEDYYKHLIKIVCTLADHKTLHQMGCTYYGEGNTSLRHNLASAELFVVLCVWV